MKFKKPKFWDYKNPNLLSYILLPLTLPIYIKNIFSIKTLVEKENLKKNMCWKYIFRRYW